MIPELCFLRLNMKVMAVALNWEEFCPQRTLNNVCRYFLLPHWQLVVEARVLLNKHPEMHRTE